jgi:hypothetical protein
MQHHTTATGLTAPPPVGPGASRALAPLTLLLMLSLLASPRALVAQGKSSGGFDSFIMLVAPRDTTSIRKQIRTAAEAGALAGTRREQAETMRLGARNRIEAKKVEIDRIRERINVARKENREADRLGLEAERKAAELEIRLMERREELRRAEIELEIQRGELGDLTVKALQLELQLAVRRAGRLRKPGGGAGGASLDRVIGELEKQTLEAQRAQAASSIDVADREMNVIDRRLELLDAQQRVLGAQ